MNITFTNTLSNVDLKSFAPIPASKLLPDWYKNLESYMNKEKKPDGQGQTTATIKRCMPVFDAMTTGYILRTHTDIFVSIKDEIPYYEWAHFDAVTFHTVEQAQNHPQSNGYSFPKFINPWAIRTPKGYSCLFIKPLHKETPINILPGIVDTDNYYSPVNFPFTLTDTKFTGLIPAGTEIVQIIPFKRDAWKSNFDDSERAIKAQNMQRNTLRSVFFDSYKTKWWQKKEYR